MPNRSRRRPKHPARRVLALAIGSLLVVAWGIWLRPATLGGRQTYIIVEGGSMEPTYHDGDLVLVRNEAAYAIGDIVAYRIGGAFDDPARVIHRIVGEVDGGFLTQGDGRDRPDPWHPTERQIVGRSIFHLPGAGDIAAAAGQPPVLAALGGVAVMLGRDRRHRRRRPDGAERVEPTDAGRLTVGGSSPQRRPTPRWLRHTEPRWAFAGAIACPVLLLPVLLGLWSSVQASTRAVRIDQVGELTQRIGLDYRFIGDPSPVYPTGEVVTVEGAGNTRAPAEPLFTRLLHRLELAVDFESTTTSGVDQSTATYTLEVTLTTPEGIVRSLVSEPPRTIETGATRVVAVDLDDVAAQVAQIDALTGLVGGQHTIRFTPTLVVEASGSGATATERLSPTVEFVFRDGLIAAQPLTDVHSTAPLAVQVPETTRYRVGPIALETPTARGVLAGLALVLAAAAGWCAAVLFGGIGLSEADQIAARYRAQLVDVSSATGPPGTVVLVGGIGELARLAKVDGSVILHERLDDGAHRYRVFMGSVAYEYQTAPDSAAGATRSDVAASDGIG